MSELSPNTVTLGKILKYYRIRKGLSMEMVYHQTNITVSYISRFENNNRIPQEKDLKKLLDLYEANKMEQAEAFGHWFVAKHDLRPEQAIFFKALKLIEGYNNIATFTEMVEDYVKLIND